MAGGLRFVLLRERDLEEEALAELAERVAAVLPADGLLAIHSRAEVARGRGAGLHLPEAGPAPPAGVLWHGRSVHGPDAVRRARSQGACYVVAGTLHESAGKPGVPGIGAAGLRAMCDAAGGVPVFAIGGIDATRVAGARLAGAHGVAVVGAILESDDPGAASAALTLALH